MKPDDRIRTIITEACEQFREQLEIHITELVPELVRDHLVATLGNLDAKPVTRPTKKPVRRAKAKVVDRDLKPEKMPPSKRRNHCRTCGAEGFQTKTCGRTHNIDAAPSATVDVPKPPPPISFPVGSVRAHRSRGPLARQRCRAVTTTRSPRLWA